ncbi:hypothetical protein [uncultured Azohydromonas sp.]|jgi:hypothetical protein|uniref:hypothetical protein n=1 Tax=uncultured Azohydromonas sp. TaxID=487342 RepID=UPI00260E1095|nr:hypothetical protein [uncultured Azohydromonas sp.]
MTLRTRLEKLEQRIGSARSLHDMTDAELMTAILRECLEREPTAAEVEEWMALPDSEFRARVDAFTAETPEAPDDPETARLRAQLGWARALADA